MSIPRLQGVAATRVDYISVGALTPLGYSFGY